MLIALEDTDIGATIQGHWILSSLRFANDIVVLAVSPEDVQALVGYVKPVVTLESK